MKVEINRAREICDIVRKNFPYESPWMQYKIGYKNLTAIRSDKTLYQDVIELSRSISENKTKLENVRDSYQLYTKSALRYFDEMIKSIQQYKVQNCGETARLGYLVSRINFIKDTNVSLGSLTTQTVYSEAERDFMFPELDKIFSALCKAEYGTDLSIIDHVVTKIRNGKNTFIVDPLLNETNGIKKMELSYKKKYSDIFDITDSEEVKIIDYPSPPYPAMPRISDEEAKILGKKYQFLVLEENKDKIKDEKKYFFDFLEK